MAKSYNSQFYRPEVTYYGNSKITQLVQASNSNNVIVAESPEGDSAEKNKLGNSLLLIDLNKEVYFI